MHLSALNPYVRVQCEIFHTAMQAREALPTFLRCPEENICNVTDPAALKERDSYFGEGKMAINTSISFSS